MARRTRQPRGLARSALPVALCVLGLGAVTAAQAFDYGPFSLTGFAKVNLGYVSNGCKDCQRDTSAGRHFIWTDDLAFGKEYGGLATDSVQIQPTLGVKFDLPQGFTVSGAYSQRYRDGKPDLPGVFYDRSVTLKHGRQQNVDDAQALADVIPNPPVEPPADQPPTDPGV